MTKTCAICKREFDDNSGGYGRAKYKDGSISYVCPDCIKSFMKGNACKQLKTWKDYYPAPVGQNVLESKTMTDVACPKCEKPLYRRNDIVLTSDPPQYQYECDCGFVGYRFQ